MLKLLLIINKTIYPQFTLYKIWPRGIILQGNYNRNAHFVCSDSKSKFQAIFHCSNQMIHPSIHDKFNKWIEQHFRSDLQWTLLSFVPVWPTVTNTLSACVKAVKFQICSSSLSWWTSVEVTCVSGVCAPASIYVCVCVFWCVLARGTSVSERMCKCGCGNMCVCVVYQLAGRRRRRRRRWTGWRCSVCVDYFLPYIAMTGHVVSPVVADGQQCSSLLAPLPLSRSPKPENKCCLLGSRGSVRMCSGPRSKRAWEEPLK